MSGRAWAQDCACVVRESGAFAAAHRTSIASWLVGKTTGLLETLLSVPLAQQICFSPPPRLAALCPGQVGRGSAPLPPGARDSSAHARRGASRRGYSTIDLNNLAVLLEAKGKLDEALPLGRQALAVAERALGADHPTTRQCCTTRIGREVSHDSAG